MNREKTTPPTLVVRRTIRAKRDKVFAAWASPEAMSRWFVPRDGRAVVTSDFRPGGHFRNEMFLGSEGTPCSEGKTSCETDAPAVHTGRYIEIIPPEKIVFTWSSAIVTDSRVTVELRERGDETELTLIHELLETKELRDMHNGGWDACLANLIRYCE